MTEPETFGLPADYRADAEQAIDAALERGDADTAAVLIDGKRKIHPAYGEWLAAKYAEHLGWPVGACGKAPEVTRPGALAEGTP